MTRLSMEKLADILRKDCRLSDCEIISEISSGNSGDVYQVTLAGHPNDKYALKVIDLKQNFMEYAGLKNNWEFHQARDAFKTYCQKEELEFTHFVKFYRHDDSARHLVKIENFVEANYEDTYLIFMLMPYFPGTLNDFQYFQPYDEDLVIDIALQCLSGLRTLHQAHICHRDIKPNNIFYILENNELVLKIGDYGLSREVAYESAEVISSNQIITRHYAAPEAYSGKTSVRSDIFSLGVTLYWLCNQYVVNEARDSLFTSENMFQRMANGSDELWQIIRKATMTKPDDRYQTADAFYQDLATLKMHRELNSPANQLKQLTLKYQQLNTDYQALQAKLEDNTIPKKVQKKRNNFGTKKKRPKKQLSKSFNNDILDDDDLDEFKTNFNSVPDLIYKIFIISIAAITVSLLFIVILAYVTNPYEMAKLYESSWFPFQDEQKAQDYYEEAIAKGNAEAMYHVAVSVIDSDSEKAIALLKDAADLNHCDAITALGIEMINEGKNEEAKEYLQKAVNLGDETAAAELCKLALSSNDRQILFDIAYNYDQGSTLPQNYTKAFEYYQYAARLGSSAAMNNIGVLYRYGRGVDQNINEAVSWYEKAAESGSIRAMENLTRLYYYGTEGLEKDDVKAFEWCEKAANAGDKEAMVSLADMYETGSGTIADVKKALEWRQKAQQE